MKNKLRKMLSLVLAVVIAMSAISVNTLAATIMNIVNGSNQKLYVDWYGYTYNFNGRLNTSTYGQIVKLNVGSSTGQVAYCIQPSKDAWTSDYTAQKTYNLLSLTQQQNLKHALIYGYQGTTKYGYNADTERIATQIVIYNICKGWFNNFSESTAVGIFVEDMSSSMATNVKACYNKIKEQMLSHLTIPSYAVKPTVTNVPKQKMTTNSDGTFTITLTDSKKVSKYYDWQTAIKKYSYLSIITDTEGKLVIKSTKPIPSGSAITLTAKRNSSKYQNNIVDVAPMYMISGSGSQSSATFVQDYDPSEAKIAIYSDNLGTAQIKKVWQHKNDSSSTQASNSDIYFTIKNSSGSAVKATGSDGSYTYSASGSVTKFKLNSSNTFSVKSLPAGTYTVTEYGKNSDGSIPYYTRTGGVSKTVTVTAGSTGTVTFTNTRNTGTGKVIKTWVDTNGNAIEASNSIANNQHIYFRIKNADNKYITVSGSKYSGSYTFTGTSTTATSLYVNPRTGEFTVSELPTGKYTVYEYGSPEGYSVNKASQTITISRDKTSSVSFVNSEDSGTAQIKKVWLSDTTLTSAQIANLEKSVFFIVKDSDGKFIKVTGSAGAYVYAGTQTTGNSLKLSGSKFNVSKLPMGTYTVTEINNASGYNPKTQTKTVTIANKGETKSVSFTNKSTPVVVIRKHFSDEDNLTAEELKAQYAKVTVNLQVLGFTGNVQTNPPAGYYVEFTGSNGNYTYKGLSSTKTSATNLKLNDKGEMTISFGTNTAPYYLSVIETYSGTEYDIDNRDQRIDLGNGDPNAVIDLDDIEINNQLKTGSVQIDKQFLDIDGSSIKIPDDKLAEVAFKIMHNGKYLTFTGSNGSYTYKGENNTGTTLKLNKSTYNFIANELPAREEYTVYEVSGTTGYSFSIDPVTFVVTPAGSVKKVFTNRAMTGTISIVKHSADGVLSGWQFRVYGTALTGQTYDKTFTTDAKGTITISNIRIGDYKVTEVKTGKTVGYITENGKDLEVKTDTVTTVNFENKPYANIVINKVDSVKGTALSGATFGIYTDAECEIPAQAYTSATDDTLTDAVITESATGKYTCNFLPIESKDGTTYYVKELTAPDHYAIDTDVHPVTLKTANSTVAVSNNATSKFYETPLGSVRTTKVDADHPDVLLSGAEFTVYQSDKATVYDKLTEISKGTYQLDEIPAGTYYLKETKAPKYYNIDNTFYQFVISDAGKVVDVSINGNDTFPNAPQKGNIKIVKRSADGVLSGWKFEVSGTALTGQKYDKTFTTDTNGKITIADLRIGNYTVEEVTTGIVGYITPDSQDVIVEHNKTAILEFTNIPIGNVHVTKMDKDYTENKLTGAEFTVYKTDKITVVGKLTEISTGEYQLNDLQYGDYFLKETKAPKNYILDNNFYAFSITEAGATVNVETNTDKGFENDAMKGTITISKHSADGKLDGWQFRVYGTALTGQKYDKTFTTDKDGKITVADLRIGNYTVEEVTTGIVGYITPDSQNVTVEYNKTATLEFINVPIGKIVLNKVDADNTNKYISGSVYAVYKDVNGNGTYEKDIDTFVKNLTDSNGIYSLDKVPYGKYLVKEISAPTGYLVDENYYPVNIDSANAEKTVSNTDDGKIFVEQPVRGAVEITKVDEEYIDNKLSGAEFTIYAEDKKSEIGKMAEVEKGIYRYEGLRYGKYYLKETKAPDYFVQDVNFYYFEITENGKTVIVTNDQLGKGTFINSPQKGKLKIVKTSYDNKVEGIHFEVTGKTYTGQTFKKTYTTDKNGIIRINDLRAGEYTVHEVEDEASAGYLLPEDKQLTIDRDGIAVTAEMYNAKIPENPPTGASEDSFTQTAVIIISMVMMSAAVVLAFPLSKRKRKR